MSPTQRHGAHPGGGPQLRSAHLPRPPLASVTVTVAQTPALFPDARGQWWPGCAGRSGLVLGRLRSASRLAGVQSMERAGRRDALSHLFPLRAQFYGEIIDTRGATVGTWRSAGPAARSACALHLRGCDLRVWSPRAPAGGAPETTRFLPSRWCLAASSSAPVPAA